MVKRKLEWGQTPFDGMTDKQLRRLCQAMYSALISANSVLSMSKHASPQHPFWGEDGSGGRALAKSDAILDPIHRKYPTGDIHECFFRYADDLLFPKMLKRGSGWYVCDCGCETMLASVGTKERPTNYIGSCKTPDKMRPLRWSDLAPKNTIPQRKDPAP